LRRREVGSFVETWEFDKATLVYLIPFENTAMYRRSRLGATIEKPFCVSRWRTVATAISAGAVCSTGQQ
jgi:hypothetical protein